MSDIAQAFSQATELLTTAPPPIGEAMAIDVMHEQYGLTATVERLAGERDCNFLVRLPGGERRVLKFYSDVDDAETRAFQHGALIHIARTGLPCPVPHLFPTRDGQDECTARVEDRDRKGILISFVPGHAAGHAPLSPELRQDIGRTAARLGLALAEYHHPASERVLLWDIMQVGHLRQIASSVENPEHRRWLERFVDRFVDEIRPQVVTLRSQIIHNDLNANNVLCDAADPTHVSGIIDFGDMVHAPLVNEIAVAATYFISPNGDPIRDIGEMLDGYESVRPLEEAEVGHLGDLVLARLATRVLIYQWRSALFPENRDYILRNSGSVWALIESLDRWTPQERRNALIERWMARKEARS